MSIISVLQTKNLARHEGNAGVYCNAHYSHELVQQFRMLDDSTKAFLQKSWDKNGLSMRGLDKTLKAARTIVDLSNSQKIELPHIAEALSYRSPLQIIKKSNNLTISDKY